MTPLLTLHGFTGSPRSWDFLPPGTELPRLVPALLGHAGSDAGSEVQSFEDEVDRLALLAPESGVHVVGYSLGARLALGLALRHPTRVTRLTLLSGHPGLHTPEERAARRASDEAWCDILLRRGVPAFVAAWQAQSMWDSQKQLPDAVRQQRQSERLSHTAQGLARSLRLTGLGEMPDYGARLAEIRVPVTLLAGAFDGKFSALARHMAEQLPQATLQLIAGAGHDLLLERPELIAEVLRRGNLT
ncbi:MAG TPA: alpha/beta fold hydrolase [Polyangiaceae bacterium]|jgi:2-succinyl-6-hydroxy-2,4-cyclohexadiene-1-carboxylate synthase|nr:alpha/beta fold hydrolase [Polyangiaceae bacterium]